MIKCMNGANFAFSDLANVMVRELTFEMIGEQSILQLDTIKPTLDFSNCTNVTIHDVTIRVNVPRGTGISLEHTTNNGEIILHNISVLHSGTHGIGIHCDVLREADSLPHNLTLSMNHILVVNTDTNTTYEPSMAFTGIMITVHGTGNGCQMSMHNITVFNSAPVMGYGILIRLLGNVHYSTTILDTIIVNDGWQKRYQNRRRDDVLADCAKKQFDILNMTQGALGNYSAITIDARTSINTINVTDVRVITSYAPSGSAVAVYLKDRSVCNWIYLGNLSFAATENAIAFRQGLFVHFADSTSINEVILQDLQVMNSTSQQGGGAYLLFTNHCRRNRIRMYNCTFTHLVSNYGGAVFAEFQNYSESNTVIFNVLDITNNSAVVGGGILIMLGDYSSGNIIRIGSANITGNRARSKSDYHASWQGYGGGFAVMYSSYAQSNNISMAKSSVEKNSAELGGGVMIIFGDFSRGNIMSMFRINVSRNRAYAGGGMYIRFHHLVKRNTVKLTIVPVISNDLLSHNSFITMGGGINIEFDTDRAMDETKNAVSMFLAMIFQNNAADGVGGGLSVLYVHSPHIRESGDMVHLIESYFWNNHAAGGEAICIQSSPKNRKDIFRGVILSNARLMTLHREEFLFKPTMQLQEYFENLIQMLLSKSINHEFPDITNTTMAEYVKHIDPLLEVQANSSMILLISVEMRIHSLFTCHCGGTSQGLQAIDSEITLQADTFARISYCVASHGGAVALYGESYIRLSSKSQLQLDDNLAFQRGGAMYVDSTLSAASKYRCFLQNDKGPIRGIRGIVFANNFAKFEGQSLYITDPQNCYNSSVMNQLLFTKHACLTSNSTRCAYQLYSFSEKNQEKTFIKCASINLNPLTCSKSEKFLPVDRETLLHPSHVDGASPSTSPVAVQFFPGLQKLLPYTHAYDRLGNVINTAFIVQIISHEPTAKVQLNIFSKYTADFRVILHGIPPQHGRFNHFLEANSTNTSGSVPLLVLQSVDNKNLVLVMAIELQCCPPGYIFCLGSDDNGTCQCGMLTIRGIAECNNAIEPNVKGAVLQRDYWAGYLTSNDQHSCDGQKFFTAPCPPGYCQTQLSTLPDNNSKQLLEEVVCGKSNRKGLLCGDCIEGNSIAVNFNGIRPVCTSCQEGLSHVGVLVWILSEWVPMLVVKFVVMLFNVDLVSGSFNSFLLFAQLLAFSSIRGDAELGTVHIAFVKIYRFLYGVWNLDFFGVLLPPYCLIPHSHLTLLQTLLLHYSIGLFPLIVAITLVVLERSAEKWICCHRVDQCLRRMRRWKAKYSDGMSYDRALPAFVILGFTRFLVSSSYILVGQTITGEDGEQKMVVWWQGSVPYGSIQHIAYFIPAIIILLVFVLLPSFLVLTLPIVPQLFGRLIIAVPPLRKLQRMQTFCSNVYTDRWVYHFVNVFQGCYKERYRSFSSLYLFHRFIHLSAAVFIPRVEDALHIQLILTEALLLLIAILRPYNSDRMNTLDTAILGNMVLILLLSEQIVDSNTHTALKLFYASVRMILIYLPLFYPAIIFGRKVYVRFKCDQLKCCQKQMINSEDNEEPLLEHPAARLGNLVNITEQRPGLPTSAGEYTETVSHTDEM